MRKNVSKWMAFFMAGVILAGSMLPSKVAEATGQSVDIYGTYHAALGVSTATKIWINRNAYFAEDANVYYATDQWDRLMSEDSATGEKVEHTGEFTDVEIKGNGTYTVTLEGADFEGETTICMLHVATDIPVCEEITFSDVSAKINNRTVLNFAEAYMENETPYLTGGMDVLLLNHWREELVNQVQANGLTESSSNGYDLLMGTGNDKIEVTFTVSGFAYDKEIEETPEVVVEPEKEATEVTSTGKAEVSVPGLLIVVSAIVLCIVVIVIVNGRSKRK